MRWCCALYRRCKVHLNLNKEHYEAQGYSGSYQKQSFILFLPIHNTSGQMFPCLDTDSLGLSEFSWRWQWWKMYVRTEETKFRRVAVVYDCWCWWYLTSFLLFHSLVRDESARGVLRRVPGLQPHLLRLHILHPPDPASAQPPGLATPTHILDHGLSTRNWDFEDFHFIHL